MVRARPMIAALLSLAFAAQEPVSLSSVPSNVLINDCAANRGMVLDLCGSYVLGVADALQITGQTCRPHSDIGTAQTLAVVRKFLADHPEHWNKSAAWLVKTPLVEAFPCSRRK